MKQLNLTELQINKKQLIKQHTTEIFTSTLLISITLIFNFGLMTEIALLGVAAAVWIFPLDKEDSETILGDEDRKNGEQLVEIEDPFDNTVDPFDSGEVYDPFINKENIGFFDAEIDGREAEIIEVKN